MGLRLLYPILYVREISAAVEYYAEVVGCSVDSREGGFAELSLGDTRIALNEADEPSKHAGCQTIVLVSGNLEGDYSRLVQKSVVELPLTETSYGRTFIVRDPDGNKIEFVEA